MSGDWLWMELMIPQVLLSNPIAASEYPMSWITLRTSFGTSTYVVVVISPETTQIPVVISTSQATRPLGSSLSTASSTESEIWSAILSGCPSVTDSDVKICRIFSDTE